jgi:hypothetical protein
MEAIQMKPIKFIAWIIVAVISIFTAFGYTTIHYEDFNNYTCLGDNISVGSCANYGWYNLTSGGAGIGGMQVDGIKALFTWSGGLRGVSHKLNKVSDTYCMNPCGNNTCPTAANFSIRVKVWQDGGSAPYDVDDMLQFGLTTGKAYTSSLYARQKLNGSASTGDSNFHYDLYKETTLFNILTTTPTTSSYNMQIDYFVQPDTSPIGNQEIYYAMVYLDDGSLIYSAGSSLFTPISANCFNASWFRFRTDGTESFRIDDLYVVQYAVGEPFISLASNISISAGNATIVQCNDSIDNDGDTLIDTADPRCSFIGDDDESPPDEIECNNTQDDDGDSLIDYPNDPGCDNASDLTESPKNYYQCNDQVDNDGDGLTDYPADSGCIGYSDNDESPKQGSNQPNDDCAVASACITKDTFPYTDDISLHSWTYDYLFQSFITNTTQNCTSSSDGCSRLKPTTFSSGTSSYDLLISYDDQTGTNSETKTLKRVFTNTNSYNRAVFKFTYAVSRTESITNESAYMQLLYGNDVLSTTRLDFKDSSPYKTQAKIYTTSGGNYQYITTAYLNDVTNGVLTIYLVADQQNGSYTLSYSDATSTAILGDDTKYYFDTISVPDNLKIRTSAENINIYLTEVYAYGALDSESVSCTTFTKPYYLKEDFLYGQLSDCGWVTSNPIVVYGELAVDTTFPEINAYKQMSETIYQDKFRYVTLEFDGYLESGQSGSIYSVFLLDDIGNTIMQIYTEGDGDLYVVPDKVPEKLTNILQDQYVNFKVVLDLINENYKLYIDNVDYTSTQSIPFYDSGFDTDSVRYLSLTSTRSNYKIDNVAVFTSDAVGNEFTGNSGVAQQVFKNDILGIWFKNTTKCVTDSDCPSGKCMPYKTCSQFNFKACDTHGLPRGNYCVIRLNIENSLLNLKDIMLDNFVLVIILIFLLMVAVYAAIIFRNRG